MRYAKLLRSLGLKRKKQPLERRAELLRRFVKYSSDGEKPPLQDFDPEQLRITWIIPDFKPGAGGHMTIFRIARHLEEFGHKVSFLIQNPVHHRTADEAKATINAHFQPFNGHLELFWGQTPSATGDALIATDRFTCYPADAMNGFIRKFYFVQDYEPAFYPAGAEALLSEATYHFDFDCLCAGDWLHDIMRKKYDRWSTSWPLAYDLSVYNVGEEGLKARADNRIALYARYVTPRRAVELAFLALELLHERGVRFEVDFFGWKLGRLKTSYPYRDHGVLNASDLAQLYRAATIGVVFSATNHSLVNKEMMACGLPVLDLDLETVRSIFPESVMSFAKPTPEGIADGLQLLLADEERRQSLQKRGLSFVESFSWRKSSRLVETALKERVSMAVRGQLS